MDINRLMDSYNLREPVRARVEQDLKDEKVHIDTDLDIVDIFWKGGTQTIDVERYFNWLHLDAKGYRNAILQSFQRETEDETTILRSGIVSLLQSFPHRNIDQAAQAFLRKDYRNAAVLMDQSRCLPEFVRAAFKDTDALFVDYNDWAREFRYNKQELKKVAPKLQLFYFGHIVRVAREENHINMPLGYALNDAYVRENNRAAHMFCKGNFGFGWLRFLPPDLTKKVMSSLPNDVKKASKELRKGLEQYEPNTREHKIISYMLNIVAPNQSKVYNQPI